MKNIWMVRAGKDAFLIDEFKNRNIVAIGWGLGDLTDKSEEDIKQLMEEKYPNANKRSLGINISQVSKFRHKIKIGDYVLTNDPSNQKYLFGRIISDYYYSTQLGDFNEEYIGHEDTRDVKWLGEIPYDNLKESTKGTLGTGTTLFNITKDAKIDIFKVFRRINDEYDNSAKIIRNYLDENNLGDFEQKEFEDAIKSFYNLFAPEILEKLEGINLLNKMFIHDGDKENLCYTLEFSKKYKIFGGIGGGSAFKYTLYKNKDVGWRLGPTQKSRNITEEEAIQVGTKIRDALVNGAKYIENAKLDTVSDYKQLNSNLNKIFKGSYVMPTSSWIHKYYALIFPNKFGKWHNEDLMEEVVIRFNILPEDGYYSKDGQLNLLANKAEIKLYSLNSGEIEELFEDELDTKNDDKNRDSNLNEDDLDEETMEKAFESDLKRNIIYFGAPGTGKSYNLNQDKEGLLENYIDNYERVTFHPDYSYANFVGTYKPVPDGDSITYKYVPGPFMRILKKALDNPSEPFLLIIEEINRANVAAVFGDVFQLLDRENNESLYSIDATEDMKSYLNQDKIKIPKNMFLWATMNSADQGVFPMDTAFKRRWDFNYFNIDTGEYKIENTYVKLNNQKISWNKLRKEINKELLSYKINEDKLLGPFFAFNEYLNEEIPENEFKEIFKNKIIMYLFEDAARSRRNNLFQGAQGDNNYVTYSQICELFDEKGIEIFCDNIKNEFSQEEEE